MSVKIDVLGYEEIIRKLNKVPEEVADAAIGDVQDYIHNVLRNDQPSPNYISRKQAYGKSFFTDKQRNYFFWALKAGNIETPYHRTQELSRGWKVEKRGLFGYITNETKGAQFVVGDKTQARLNKLVGWKTVKQQIEERADKINKIIDAAVKKALRKLRLI